MESDGALHLHPDAGADAPRDVTVADAAADVGQSPDSSVADGSGKLDAPAATDASDAANVVDARADTAEASVTTCADGASIAYTRTSCTGTPPAVPSSLASAAQGASFGSIVSLGGLDDSSLPCFPVRVCVASDAPTLLFSDDPESPSADGVLYADSLVTGNYRAYVYHTNAGTGLRKFPVVLLNQGTSTVHATVTASGIAGPSQDYIDVGKQALVRWLESQGTTTTVAIPAGQRVLLSADLDAAHASTNDLAHAIIDFSVDGPVKMSVVSVVSTEDATVVTAGLTLLADDGVHARGSFPGAALEIESIGAIDGAGARHLRLGGNVTDATLVGHDYVDGTSVTLDGNYGVSYAFTLAFASSAPSAVLLSPQGGDWGGAALTASTSSVLPASQDALGTQTDAIAVGAFAGGASLSFTLLSAGGSNLPVDLVTAPTQ